MSKEKFLKLLKKLLFGTSHARIRFLDRVAKRRSLYYFAKKIPPQTLSQEIWKLSKQTKETLAVESVVGIVIVS